MKNDNRKRMDWNGRNLMRGQVVFLAAMVWMIGLSGRLPAVAADAPDRVLTRAAEVRALSAAEAERKYPVKLRGVVTFYDDALFLRFIQDDSAGIYLMEMTNTVALQAGQLVEVTGVTGPGEFAPVVIPTRVEIVGEGKIPDAKPATVARLLSGAEDSQMVEISGNVRAARYEKQTGNYFVDVVAGGERFTVITRQLPVAQPGELLDATVRVRGVCATLFNHQRQLFGLRLLVPAADGLTVEQAAPANPFEVAARPIDSLLQFTTQENLEQRVKVTGTVVYFEPGNSIYIQNGAHGLHCRTLLREPLKAGDQVEVLGSPAKGEYTPILEDAIYRKTGSGPEPKATPVNLNEVLTGAYDCGLVQMNATVLDRVDRGINQFLLLKAGEFVFEADLPPDAAGAQLADLANGSDVLLTGICLIERGNNWQAGKDWRAKSFRLLLRSAKDITVLQAPTSASNETPLLVICIVEALILLAVFWRYAAGKKGGG